MGGLHLDVEFYKNIHDSLSDSLRQKLLEGLNDVVYHQSAEEYSSEPVFNKSFLRSVSIAAIKGQFLRVLKGGAVTTKYHFSYSKDKCKKYSGVELDFHVTPDSSPPTNMHVIIGRNGSGKTTLLNNMVLSLVHDDRSSKKFGAFYDVSELWDFDEDASPNWIRDEYFTGVVSVSFSAFDDFEPPPERQEENSNVNYTYVGLKRGKIEDKSNSALKNKQDLHDDFILNLKKCFSSERKKERWLIAIKTLESDMNFEQMDLTRLVTLDKIKDVKKQASKAFMLMSSGHAIVLLTITRLIVSVQEKTLILIDEPESHLHPPLLSAFVRAISNLLTDRNGVAIVATHSPVILQEVPKSCVWKLRRSKLELTIERLPRETFGENVGTLTYDVFGLEVTKSGFHNLLNEDVQKGMDIDEILYKYKNQLGFEAKSLIYSLLENRKEKD
jgi:predicted ATPase